MKLVKNIKFGLTCTQKGDDEPYREIIISGNRTGKYLPGRKLEQVVCYQNFYLFFFTEDTPFEETLSIFLLDNNFDVIDSAVIGSIYASGVFDNFEIISQDKVGFNFLGDFRWYVKILPHFKFRIFLSNYVILKRKYRLKQHFVITHD